jgi:HlyD family secretion protein
VKKLLLLLAIAALGLGGVAYFVSQRAGAVTAPPRHEKIDRGNISEQVNATGKLIFKDIFIVASEAPGRVVQVFPEAEVGKKVTKGSPLLRLDDDLAKAKLEEAQSALAAAQSLQPQAEAKLEEAKSAVKAAEALEMQAGAKRDTAEAQVRLAKSGLDLALKEHDRALKLKGEGDLSRDKLESAEKAVNYAREGVTVAEAQIKEADAAILAAKSNVLKAKAGIAEADAAILGAKATAQRAKTAVTLAEKGLDLMTIKAPGDGIILEQKVIKGQMIAPQATPILFILAPDLNRLELIAQVGESDISKVRDGMKVKFSVDAYTDEGSDFVGEVTRIANVPSTMPSRDGLPAIVGPVFYQVNIDVKTAPSSRSRPLKAGYTANVNLLVRKVENVLRVATAAFNYRPEPADPAEDKRMAEKMPNGWKPLWTWAEGEKPRMIFVKTGANDGTKTEISEVADGDKLPEGPEIITEAPPTTEKGGLFDSPTKIRL